MTLLTFIIFSRRLKKEVNYGILCIHFFIGHSNYCRPLFKELHPILHDFQMILMKMKTLMIIRIMKQVRPEETEIILVMIQLVIMIHIMRRLQMMQ